MINGIFRVPKEMRASLVFYVAMFVLYLAIARSFDSIYRGELRYDWTDHVAIGWGKAQDALRREAYWTYPSQITTALPHTNPEGQERQLMQADVDHYFYAHMENYGKRLLLYTGKYISKGDVVVRNTVRNVMVKKIYLWG